MYHAPVLSSQVLHYLIVDRNGIYLDGTAGGGGHSEAILNELTDAGKLISLDMDAEALQFSGKRLKRFGRHAKLAKSNFKNFDHVLAAEGVEKINGILLDLGVSSHQLDEANRGFSFSKNGKLDMRMNSQQDHSAYDLVNSGSESELMEAVRDFGEERRFKPVVRAIIKERKLNPIASTAQLVDAVSSALPPEKRIKSLARIFQGIRIAVNEELTNLKEALEKTLSYLAPHGRIVVLSYHSLEDRITKQLFKKEASSCECPPELPICVCNKKNRLKILTRRAVKPTEIEMKSNPRSRSAKLRAAEFIR